MLAAIIIIIYAKDGGKNGNDVYFTILTHTGTDWVTTMRLPNAIEITKQNEYGKEF